MNVESSRKVDTRPCTRHLLLAKRKGARLKMAIVNMALENRSINLAYEQQTKLNFKTSASYIHVAYYSPVNPFAAPLSSRTKETKVTKLIDICHF